MGQAPVKLAAQKIWSLYQCAGIHRLVDLELDEVLVLGGNQHSESQNFPAAELVEGRRTFICGILTALADQST